MHVSCRQPLTGQPHLGFVALDWIQLEIFSHHHHPSLLGSSLFSPQSTPCSNRVARPVPAIRKMGCISQQHLRSRSFSQKPVPTSASCDVNSAEEAREKQSRSHWCVINHISGHGGQPINFLDHFTLRPDHRHLLIKSLILTGATENPFYESLSPVSGILPNARTRL